MKLSTLTFPTPTIFDIFLNHLSRYAAALLTNGPTICKSRHLINLVLPFIHRILL
ncbi:hypothetical protein TWF132_011420, partial [Orbilia oligospora]